MLGAYGWAFEKPMRKLFYNLNITFISVLVALLVGAIEVLSVVQTQMNLGGPFWNAIASLSGNFGLIGGIIIGLFILSWIVSTIIYKVKRYDDITVKQTTTTNHVEVEPVIATLASSKQAS